MILRAAPDPVVDDPSWQDKANCVGANVELFFPPRGASTREARMVCASCVVRQECLDHAIEHGEKVGIWGGLSAKERKELRMRRAAEA